MMVAKEAGKISLNGLRKDEVARTARASLSSATRTDMSGFRLLTKPISTKKTATQECPVDISRSTGRWKSIGVTSSGPQHGLTRDLPKHKTK